ncbi:hypothetical protein KKD81_02935 [Patescibacteria group bacterium]|nr:hypothetical protein [Patescibacteria group bacterium]MBU2220866.1 hypothetical protein [Patescibacteria group bacterium]
MNKNLNDIIPPSRRRNMQGEDGAPAYTPPAAPEGMQMPSGRPQYQRPLPPSRGGRKFPIGTAIIALVVIAASVGALVVFSGAKVTVTPATNESYVTGDFIATVSGGDLPFEFVTVEKTATASVTSEGSETVNQPAQGTITILNKQATPQQLIKNTRFETPDGLVFRIHESVSVPAARGDVPGELNVTAYADASGDTYNVGPTTFTLPGLSGSATFSLVTARSDSPMSGGFSGTRASVGQATRDAKMAELRAALAPQIDEAIMTAAPEGYVLIPGASSVSYVTQPDGVASGGNVELSEKAVATAIVFPKTAIAKAIALQVVGAYAGQPVTLSDASGLALTSVGDLPAPGAQEFAFSLAGNVAIEWIVEQEKIAGAVAGKTRDSAEVVLSGFPEVDSAVLVLRPFWSNTFPQDPEKITVEVKKTAP